MKFNSIPLGAALTLFVSFCSGAAVPTLEDGNAVPKYELIDVVQVGRIKLTMYCAPFRLEAF